MSMFISYTFCKAEMTVGNLEAEFKLPFPGWRGRGEGLQYET